MNIDPKISEQIVNENPNDLKKQSEKLAEKLNEKTEKEKKPKSTKPKKPRKKFLKVAEAKRTAYQKRKYMQVPDKEGYVYASSTHTIASAKEECLAYMRAQFKETGEKQPFKTGELAEAIHSRGSAWGDVIRMGMKKAEKEGLVKISIDPESKRSKYRYQLL